MELIMKNNLHRLIGAAFISQLIACSADTLSSDTNIYSSGGNTDTITISWNAPSEYTNNTTMNDLTGYKIYYGTSPDSLTHLIDTPANLTSYTIEYDRRFLSNTTYYVGLTAFSSNRFESEMSELIVINTAE